MLECVPGTDKVLNLIGVYCENVASSARKHCILEASQYESGECLTILSKFGLVESENDPRPVVENIRKIERLLLTNDVSNRRVDSKRTRLIENRLQYYRLHRARHLLVALSKVGFHFWIGRVFD